MKNDYRDDSLREPAYHKRAPYHPYEPDTNGLINGSYGVFAIPFPIGHRGKLGPYATGALGWREMDNRFQHTPFFAAGVHLTLAALQLPGNSTPMFEGRPGTPSTRDAMMAFIRHIEKRATKEDKVILQRHVPGQGIRQDLMFDLEVADAIHAIVSGALNDSIPGREDMRNGRGARQGGGDEDIVDGVDMDMRYDDDEGGGRGRRGGRRRQRYEEDEGEAEEDGQDAEGEMDLRIRELLDEMLDGREGENVVEKVKVIFVHYTRPPLDDDGRPIPGVPEEDAGCIMFGFIMDPLYSLGRNFASIVEMCEEHKNMKHGMKSGAGVTDAEMPKKRQNHGPDAKISRLVQIFPWLSGPEHANNALLSLDKDSYARLVSFIRDDPGLIDGQRGVKVLSRGMEDPGSAGNPNPLHPINVFTPDWAMSIMRQYGVSSEKCSMSALKNDPEWDIRAMAEELDLPVVPDDDDDDDLGDAPPPPQIPAQRHRESDHNRWFVPPEDSYHYRLDAIPWAKNGYAGLYAQYFPWVHVPDQLLRMAALRASGNSLAIYEADGDRNMVSVNWTAAMIRDGIGVIMPLPIVPYDPNAMVRHSAIIQMAEENGRMMSTLTGPRDPKSQKIEYAEYCKQLKEYRAAFMMRALQVLTPTAHINVSTQIILTYMAREVRRVSTYLPHYDWNPDDFIPEMWEMDSFAQFMIREALDIGYARHVVGPARAWQTTHYGVQDCHSTTNVDMHYSVIFHGPPEAGKSFVVKDATVKSCIPDSVTTMLESSNRAFNTHDDVSGCIFFKDEVDDIYVNAKAAERDRTGTAERLKTMLTDHKTTYRVLVFVDQNGRQRRMAEDIESLFHATFACATNKKCSGGDEAIASRFLNFVMTKADCNLYDYLGLNGHLDDEDTQYNNDLIHAWRVKQGLLCIAQVLVDAKVLPEPSMDVFSKIQSKFFAYLEHQGVDVSKIRGTQMTQRLARVYVFLNGLIQLYDVPGAKYTNKDFDMSQLIDLIPYLYCTKQIAIFAITQTSEIYIHPTRVVAMHAIFAFAKFPFVVGKTIEQYYRDDVGRAIPWRVDNAGDEAKAMINFNYIKLTGKIKDTIIAGIAEHCEPKLGINETESVVAEMAKTFIKVNAVQPMFEHTYKNAQNIVYPLRDENITSIPVVVREYTNECMYVAVEALAQLDEDLLINAFGSCIHEKFRPQKFLLGLHFSKEHPSENKQGVVHHYNAIYRTVDITPEVVANCSFVEAFTVPDVAYIPSIVRMMMSGARRHPDRAAEGETYSTNRVKRTKANLEINEDLDDWGHELHHYRSGCPGSHHASPSRQVAVYNNIRKHLAKLEIKHRQNDKAKPADLKIPLVHDRALMLDYPNELIHHIDLGLEAQEDARFSATVSKTMTEVYKAEHAEWKKAVTIAALNNEPLPQEPFIGLLSKQSSNAKSYERDYGKKRTTHQFTDAAMIDSLIASMSDESALMQKIDSMTSSGDNVTRYTRKKRARDALNPDRLKSYGAADFRKRKADSKRATTEERKLRNEQMQLEQRRIEEGIELGGEDFDATMGQLMFDDDEDANGPLFEPESPSPPPPPQPIVKERAAVVVKKTYQIAPKTSLRSILSASHSNSGWNDDDEEDNEDDPE